MSPVIIVRYFLGTGGRFICSLLHSLIEPVKLVESHRAHLNCDHDKYHNYNRPWRDMSIYGRLTHSGIMDEKSLKTASEYFANEVKFGPEYNGLPAPAVYIISCHAFNPEPMILGIANSRLLNITYTDADLDQIAYNWTIKNIIQDSHHEELYQLMGFVGSEWPADRAPMPEPDWRDLRQISYMVRWLNNGTSSRFNDISKRYPNALNIAFSDINTGNLTNRLDDIINYCGIQVSDERRENAISLIAEYSAAQIPVPWNLKEKM